MTQEATSKKSAQTNVAWAYIDWLIQKGMVNPSELPPRPDAQNQNIAYNQQVASQAVAANDARYGGWTTENARQRLNRFCVQQGITCNIINQVGGTPQQKITTADLVLNVNGKELRAHAQVKISLGSTNRQGTDGSELTQDFRIFWSGPGLSIFLFWPVLVLEFLPIKGPVFIFSSELKQKISKC